MVLAAAGGVDHQKLVDLGKQYFGDLGGVDDNFILESGKFATSYVSFICFPTCVFFKIQNFWKLICFRIWSKDINLTWSQNFVFAQPRCLDSVFMM